MRLNATVVPPVPEQKVKECLKIAKDYGCQNILALRGDPPNGQSTWTATEGGFSKAIDLVRYIRAEYGDYFDIAVAGFPQGHPETEESEEAQRRELRYLKEKVDAGANFIFTQMFYDFEIFSDWVKRVRLAGIAVPIVPGIMPIQSLQKFTTWVAREKIVVPPHFYDVLLPVKDDDEKVREVGTKLISEMCRQILESDLDICGLHVYTLNLEKGATMLLDALGLDARREQVQPFPWRPVSDHIFHFPSVALHADAAFFPRTVPYSQPQGRIHPADLLGESTWFLSFSK